ncbi:MAG: hypothetical protein Q9181_005042 [Wetmoreana brouardii]
MSCDVEPSNPMKPRKRAREDDNPEDDSLLPKPKQHCSQFESSLSCPPPAQQDLPLPTPPFTASPKCEDPQTHYEARRSSPGASPESEPKRLKRPFEPDNDAPAPTAKRLFRHSSSERPKTWFLDDWIEVDCPVISAQEATKTLDVMPTVEKAEDSEQMSQQQDEDGTAGSQSVHSERLNTSSPMFRGLLRAYGILMDVSGRRIPLAVQEMVTKHIRKQNDVLRLGEEQVDTVIKLVEKVWNSAEPKVSDIVRGPLFPLEHDELGEGRDLLWDTLPLRGGGQSNYPYALPAPKTDRHYGFPTTQTSTWSWDELGAADHTVVRPYSQPTRENIFPLFLIEIKSESSRGTLYGAEGQLALAGYHRVRSWLWVLDQVAPERERKATDAVVFSCAVSQREAVAHVHYYNPEDNMHYMSYIDSFYHVRDMQKCVNHVKNVVEWLVKIQQPIIRNALAKLYPMTLLWKKRKSEASESSRSQKTNQSSKSQRACGKRCT